MRIVVRAECSVGVVVGGGLRLGEEEGLAFFSENSSAHGFSRSLRVVDFLSVVI